MTWIDGAVSTASSSTWAHEHNRPRRQWRVRRIEYEGRPSLELGPGDIVSFPPGVAMTWHVTTPFKELWMFAG